MSDLDCIRQLAADRGMSLGDYLTMIEQQIRRHVALAEYELALTIRDRGLDLDDLLKLQKITRDLRDTLGDT